MAVGLPIVTRKQNSGVQRNQKTSPIPTGPNQRINVAQDPGVAGGPRNIPLGAFGTGGGVEFGRAMQEGANSVIADEQARKAALQAALDREQAKIDTLLLDNYSNAYEQQITGLDVNFNPLDTNALAKANGMYQKPYEATLRLAEGSGENFKERLKIKLDTVRDTQLGALSSHQRVEQTKIFTHQWQAKVGQITSRANGYDLIKDLTEAERISFDYREGLELSDWETARLKEFKKITTSHLAALRRQFPLEVARKEYNRLLGDPVVQGILQDDLHGEIDKMVKIEKAAAERKNSNPIAIAEEEIKRITKLYVRDHPKETHLPYLQEAAIWSKQFKPTPKQIQEGADKLKIEHFNFMLKYINLNRINRGQAILNPAQESELFNTDKFSPSLLEESESKKEEAKQKTGRDSVSIEDINERRVANGLPVLTPIQEEDYHQTGKFSRSPVDTENENQQIKTLKEESQGKDIARINDRRAFNGQPALTKEQETEQRQTGKFSPSQHEKALLEQEKIILDEQTAVKLIESINANRITSGLDPLDTVQEQEVRDTGKFTPSPQEAALQTQRVAQENLKHINQARVDNGLEPLSGADAAKLLSGVETSAEQGTREGEKNLHAIAALLGKPVKDLTQAERKLKLRKGIVIKNQRESAFSSKAGESLADRLETFSAAAEEGHRSNLQLDSITTVLKTDSFDTGILPDTRIFLGTAATYVQDKLGIDMSAIISFLGSPAAGNQLDAAGKRLLLQLAKGIGRITNLSLRFAQDAVPGIFRTKDGLEMISALMKRENDINIGLGRIADKALGMPAKDARVFFRDASELYRKNNPLFNRELQDRMLDLANKHRDKGAKKYTRVDMFAKAPKKRGMKFLGTKNGAHWYRDNTTGNTFKEPIYGEDAISDPVGKVKKTSAPAAPAGQSGTAVVTDVSPKVSLDQVQSVVTDLAEKIDPETLKNIMIGIQDLYQSGKQ